MLNFISLSFLFYMFGIICFSGVFYTIGLSASITEPDIFCQQCKVSKNVI